MNNHPIGILDSGVGGLSIWKEIVKELPNESTIYLADSKNCPYGEKSEDKIYTLAKRLIEFLLAKKVKLTVLACNTITVFSLDRLRSDFPQVPIIGIVPAVKTAAEISKNKRIGILSTPATSKSKYQKRLIGAFASDCEVVNIGTDKPVPLIEKGKIEREEIESILKTTLKEFIEKGVDTIALGCSHFPFLKSKIEEIMGNNVKILDSGEAIARRVERVLVDNNDLGLSKNPSYTFYTTGDAVEFTKVSKKLLGDGFGELIKSIEAVSL